MTKLASLITFVLILTTNPQLAAQYIPPDMIVGPSTIGPLELEEGEIAFPEIYDTWCIETNGMPVPIVGTYLYCILVIADVPYPELTPELIAEKEMLFYALTYALRQNVYPEVGDDPANPVTIIDEVWYPIYP